MKPRHPKARTNATTAGAEGGKARTEAKSAASAASLVKARAARLGSAAIAAMSATELALRASLEPSNRGKARWLRRIAGRGLTLTPAQRAILAREAAKRAAAG